LKQSKAAVEEDEDQVGSTPKLVLPKPRLRLPAGGSVQVRTDWNDVHVYLLAPWVRLLLQKRTSLSSLHDDLLPLLISRQFQGVQSTFQQQQHAETLEEDPELLEQLFRVAPLNSMKTNASSVATNPIVTRRGEDEDRRARQVAFPSIGSVHSNIDNDERTMMGRRDLLAVWLNQPFAVAAVLGESSRPAALRACTIPWYLYANRELVLQHIASITASGSIKSLGAVTFPQQTAVHAKFQSIILPNTFMGDKVTFKAVTIGRNCKIGSKCKLNNVVVMDDVVLGDNCLLQNCVVGTASKLGDGCHLNDCQVAPNTVVASGTKEKGEALVSDDQDDEDQGTDDAAF
jgi:translation initiation factor eIF-2B subunit gamma